MKTDIQLRDDVLAELEWEPSVHAAQIGVEAKDGVITLQGRVGSYGEKWDAERAVQRVAGVQSVAVDLDVHLAGDTRRDDSDIAISVNHALGWQNFVPTKQIKALVEDGFVTLSGTVTWEYQRAAAATAVRYLMGVKGVNNQIHVEPVANVGLVKEEIEAALKRRAHDEALKIGVVVNGARVTLSGVVPDWNERSIARETAWNTPGVRNVVDNMKIS
jgi:osmotically-inducible protein OsmY